MYCEMNRPCILELKLSMPRFNFEIPGPWVRKADGRVWGGQSRDTKLEETARFAKNVVRWRHASTRWYNKSETWAAIMHNEEFDPISVPVLFQFHCSRHYFIVLPIELCFLMYFFFILSGKISENGNVGKYAYEHALHSDFEHLFPHL